MNTTLWIIFDIVVKYTIFSTMKNVIEIDRNTARFCILCEKWPQYQNKYITYIIILVTLRINICFMQKILFKKHIFYPYAKLTKKNNSKIIE